MAAAYPTNFSSNINDREQRSNTVHVQLNPYDHEQTLERTDSTMDRTAQYVSGLNSNVNSFPTNNHSPHNHHHHRHHSPHTLPPLTIRRHPPGSNVPSLQKLPINLQSSDNNISSSSNLHVTIKRNPPIPPDQTVIQPILYPVAVYVNSPIPQNLNNQPIKEITKPSSPKKPISPVKITHTPPDRYETESLHSSSSSRNKNLNTSPRRPIRVDLIPPTPSKLEPQSVRSNQVIVEEYDDYDEYYRIPDYSVPKKVISYRTAPGMTTRELENDHMDDTGKPFYVQSPQAQTVTYRAS